jgi:hypothetical protein
VQHPDLLGGGFGEINPALKFSGNRRESRGGRWEGVSQGAFRCQIYLDG